MLDLYIKNENIAIYKYLNIGLVVALRLIEVRVHLCCRCSTHYKLQTSSKKKNHLPNQTLHRITTVDSMYQTH